MAQTSRRSQPPWRPPNGSPSLRQPKLVVYNTLTRSKVPFVPADPNGVNVTWYICGPTVYDDAHTGHARNYVSTDIIRRILKYYFKYNVKFVMNVTDVDDKIIVKAREEKLFVNFKLNESSDAAQKLAREAFDVYCAQRLPALSRKWDDFQKEAEMFQAAHLRDLAAAGRTKGDDEAKMELHIRTLIAAWRVLSQSTGNSSALSDDFYDGVCAVVKPFLDRRDGHNFDRFDHSPFNSVSRKYEQRFFEDMDRLNVLRPDVLTRVTEYDDKIIQFVQKIVDSGFAYNVDGSIYFDIDAFEKAGKQYARLRPENRGDTELQAEGEGTLSKGGNKRFPADFALWKVSKPGEPAWKSPWGYGRPGWHIECSAMASDHFGKAMDIHSGGIDLAFPHHDNELAQSEAYWHESSDSHDHSHQWVNYFLHMGHLTNKGQKMSKSLKNFTTIREALKTWSPRSLRIVYLLAVWNQPMEMSEDMLKDSDSWEKTVNNFFLKAKAAEREPIQPAQHGNSVIETHAGDEDLKAQLKNAQQAIDEALADSFDTPRVMNIVRELISKYNSIEKSSLSKQPILDMAAWVTRIVRILGLDEGKTGEEDKPTGWSGVELPEDIRDCVYKLSDLRDGLRATTNKILKTRKMAARVNGHEKTSLSESVKALHLQSVDVPQQSHSQRSEDAKALIKRFQECLAQLQTDNASVDEYLKLSDTVRDQWLWELGVYLEDTAEEGQPAIVRPLDSDMIRAREEGEKASQAKAAAKKREQEKHAQIHAEKAEKAKVDPHDMFKSEEKRKEFSAWDEDGIPTKDEKGEDLAKNKLKKVKKEWETQKKAFEAWRQKQKAS